MIRLTLLLAAVIWVAMILAPELEEPVFTEMAAAPKAPAPEAVEESIEDFKVTAIPAKPAKPLISLKKSAPLIAAESTADETGSKPAPRPVQVVSAPETITEPVITTEPEPITRYVTATRVNVRQGPSTGYAVLGQVLYGQDFEVISDLDDEWIKIRIEGDGIEGYIAKRLSSEEDPLQ